MIESMHIWVGTATAMYMDEYVDACRREERSIEGREIVSVMHNSRLRSKDSIAEYLNSLIDDDEALFFPRAVVAIDGPTGDAYKEWVGRVVKHLDSLDTECIVLMTVPFMTPSTAPALVSNMPGVHYHDYSLPDNNEMPWFLIDKFAERGITTTEKQMRYLRSKADLDPVIIGESFRSLCALGRDSGALTNDMVKSVVGERVGVGSIFDFEEAAEAGRGKAIKFCDRIVKQKNAQGLCMQLVASCLSRYRALILIKSGFSLSEVREGTSFEKTDGTQWSMSDKQLAYLSNRVARNWSMRQLTKAMDETTRAYAALKGGIGARSGREFIMHNFAVGIADAKSL